MQVAEVSFFRRDGAVMLVLAIDGVAVMESSSQESLAREISARGARRHSGRGRRLNAARLQKHSALW